MTKLVIVESPAKVRPLADALGNGWIVEASRGHVRDFPEAELGIDLEHGFEPQYRVAKGQRGLVNRLKKAIQTAEAIYVATDDDQNGEAIAWHILALAHAELGEKPVYRLRFNAVTKAAVLAALASPETVNRNWVEAQQARWVIDRLVSHLVSPLASRALEQPVSVGRLSSICLHLVVAREREIQAFCPTPYWTLAVRLTSSSGDFTAHLAAIQDKRAVFRQRDLLDQMIRWLDGAAFRVSEVRQGEKASPPLPPFTTASLLGTASQTLDLSPEHAMDIAQILYESGWITCPRTDGVKVTPEAQEAARQFIGQSYGSTYVPAQFPIYQSAIDQQAIRPTEVTRLPESLPPGEGTALYGLIWKCFVASQMAAARYEHTGVRLRAGKTADQPYPLDFQAHGRQLTFQGWRKVYGDISGVAEPSAVDTALPMLREGDSLTLAAWLPETRTTAAPPRYTPATFIRALAEWHLGWPASYALTLKLLQDKGFLQMDCQQIVPTDTGLKVCDLLVAHFPSVFNGDYAALLEQALDQVAAGQATRSGLVQTFWDTQLAAPLKTLSFELAAAQVSSAAPRVVGVCPVCGGNLVERRTAKGTLTRCEHYPICKGRPVRFTSARKVKQA